MSEIIVALDAGHGGSDNGASYGDRKEKDDVLRLTLAVGQILENSGVNVFYVRTEDEYETPFKKATDANNAGADYFVSFHRNSSETPGQYTGAETLVYNDDGVKAVMARNINAELEKAGYRNLGIDERPNLVVLKRTQMPAVLVEVGFINNEADNRIFDENFNLIAQGIANGILNTIYAGARKTDVEDEQPVDLIPEDFTSQDTRFNNNDTPEVPSDNMPLYRVQVGSYSQKSNADRMLDSLLVEGFPAFIIYDDGYYKVQVGAFKYLSNAIKMERRLRRFRYNTYIVYS